MPCKNQTFCFNAKKIFLTYSQCDLQKEVLLEHLKEIQPVSQYTIGREKHKDGGYHLHAVLSFEAKVHIHDPRKFDIENFHPNIKSVPTVAAYKNFQKYAKKDGDFISTEVDVLSKRDQLMRDLSEQGLTPEFVRTHPQIMYCNLANLRSWLCFLSPPKMDLKNLPKKRHIWISGQRNTGKTTWMRIYQSLFEYVCVMPYNNDWTFYHYNCDLIVADEYKGQLTIQQLNGICDGGAHVNTKGGSVILGQPLVVICSNYSISECYRNVEDDIRETVVARFNSYVAPIFPKFPSCPL